MSVRVDVVRNGFYAVNMWASLVRGLDLRRYFWVFHVVIWGPNPRHVGARTASSLTDDLCTHRAGISLASVLVLIFTEQLVLEYTL